jgi:GT2 family glycosyltransferase
LDYHFFKRIKSQESIVQTSPQTRAYPRVLIMIVTWNKKEYVLELLASLQKLDYPADALDVVVVDNASNDGTAAAVREVYPHVNLVCNPENTGGSGGFTTAMRWGLDQPEDRYDYWWLLDNDVLVHRQALSALVDILEKNEDIAVAGSTMMQLDYPWRINEMGCFFHRGNGMLVLHRHLEEIPAWRGKSLQNLRQDEVDLSRLLMHCRPFLDVDYVAAASLLVRPQVVRNIGLWQDYFIHYDDVEWCLRIGDAGWRVVASAQSVIWHLSAAAKIPTWVLYYDNRNVLDTLQRHGANPVLIQRNIRYVLKKALYYSLVGKQDLARLHHEAVADFRHGHLGKKDIRLDYSYQAMREIAPIFADKTIKKVLVSFSVNLQATALQEPLFKAMLERPDLEVFFLENPHVPTLFQIPRQRFVPLSANRFGRWLRYGREFGKYDLVIQSDYQMIIGLSWLGREVLFVNDEGFCQRPKPRWRDVWSAALVYLKNWF